MPKTAVQGGGADEVLALTSIAGRLTGLLEQRRRG
jgi:chemotaxis response regulator CheB